jgi:hypothetical protein
MQQMVGTIRNSDMTKNTDHMALLFAYKWHSRFFWIPWSLVWFLAGIYITASAMIRGVAEVEEIFLLWCVLSLLILIGFVFGMRITIILSPLKISSDGIKGNLRSDGFEYWPKYKPGFMRWQDTDKVETFSFPDMDSLKMGKKSGMRLVSKSGEKMVIYEHIQQYGELLSRIRSEFDKVKAQ